MSGIARIDDYRNLHARRKAAPLKVPTDDHKRAAARLLSDIRARKLSQLSATILASMPSVADACMVICTGLGQCRPH